MTNITHFLEKFIKQANTDSLKTADYPKELQGLKMKVSFGQGAVARVPWVSFTAPGMTVSNGYYPVYLYYKELNILILSYGVSETSEYTESWPLEITENKTKISSLIESPPRYGDSYIFKYYSPLIEGGKVKFYKDEKQLSSKDMDNDLSSLVDFYKKHLDLDVKDTESFVSRGLFYMEQQLEDFLIENWQETELGKKYDLILEEGVLKSQQFSTDIGRIDILAKDKKNNNHVVIELKKNQTSDDTVGQILRYMGWVKEKMNDNAVKGIIIAGKYDEKLYYATKMVNDIDIFLYEVNFNLNEYKK